MKTIKNTSLSLMLTLAFVAGVVAQESSSPLYEQKIDVVYGEVHGTGLLMDIFTPKGKGNGLAIIDVVSGAWHSDRGKIRDHTTAQFYAIFCGRGYTVFAVRPGSRTRYTGLEMASHVKMGIRYAKLHAAEYKIDPDRLGISGASAGGHLATLVAVTPEDGNPDAGSPLMRLSARVKAAAVFFPPTDFLDWNGKSANYGMLGICCFLVAPRVVRKRSSRSAPSKSHPRDRSNRRLFRSS